MAHISHKEQSRLNWGIEGGTKEQESLKLGCLQRIADAAEKMAQSYSALIDERDRYKRWCEENRAHVSKLHHKVRGLRGTITRLKRKAASQV